VAGHAVRAARFEALLSLPECPRQCSDRGA
jgi:hypothetical protein